MDPNQTTAPASTDLGTLKQNAYNASANVQNLTTDAPTLLQQLKQNLVGIFTNNNPVMDARNQAAQDYMNEGANTRAMMTPTAGGSLPTMPNGRMAYLSPTQQDSIVTARQNAALVPLVGYNQAITGMGGNISDLLKTAGDIYGSTIQGAQANASNLLDLYKTAVAEIQARNAALAYSNPFMSQIISALIGNNNNNGSGASAGGGNTTDPYGIFTTQPKPKALPNPGSMGPSNVSGASATLGPARPQVQPQTFTLPAGYLNGVTVNPSAANPTVNVGGVSLPFTL